jgi:hypothetical protein
MSLSLVTKKTETSSVERTKIGPMSWIANIADTISYKSTCLPLGAAVVAAGVATRFRGIERCLGVGASVRIGEEDHGQDGSDEEQLKYNPKSPRLFNFEVHSCKSHINHKQYLARIRRRKRRSARKHRYHNYMNQIYEPKIRGNLEKLVVASRIQVNYLMTLLAQESNNGSNDEIFTSKIRSNQEIL